MQQIISSVLPIFLIILLGKLIRSYWLKSDEFWRGLEALSYYLLFPGVLFNYISCADIGSSSVTRLVIALVISTIFTASCLVFAQKRFEIEGKVFTSIFQGGIRYNSYMLFGLGDALYGKDGMIIISVIAAYMIVLTNFLSVLAFSVYAPLDDEISKKRGVSQWSIFIKNLVMNPLIISSLAGFIFNNFGIELSDSLQKTTQTLANSALSVGILCVGAGLKLNLSSFNKFAILISCTTKLVIMPAISFVIFRVAGIDGLAYSVGLLYSSLPTATNSYLLSKQLGGDSDAMSSIITIGILLSVLSLAIFTYILC